MFVYDSLAPIIIKDFKRTLFYATPAFVCVSLYIAFSTLPSYAAQKGVVLLAVNYA